MQAPAHEFKVGDKAVYPAQGVAEVIRIEEKDIAGSRQSSWSADLPTSARIAWFPAVPADAFCLLP